MTHRFLAAAILAVTVVAAADTVSAQSVPKGYLQAVGGATFGTEPSWVLGGGAGVTIGRHLQVIGEFGYLRDVLPSSLHDKLDRALEGMSEWSDVAVSADMEIRAWFGAGGTRFLLPGSPRITPYVDVTAGVAHLMPHVIVKSDGMTVDVSGETDLNADKALLGLGGGVDIGLSRRMGLLLGYQYTRIFTGDLDINTHRATAGISVKF